MRRRLLRRGLLLAGETCSRPDTLRHQGKLYAASCGEIIGMRPGLLLITMSLATSATIVATSAIATHVSVYLKNYYTDYEIVRDCSDHDHLTAADAEMAKNAISKIEAYYLHQDPSINKDSLWKEAASNKDAALKMITLTKKVDPRQFCHASL
ncbi:MAG: hypothetical protein WB662_15015, partial [Methyloceanibacter sp.]